MKKLLSGFIFSICFIAITAISEAQEYFTITTYDVNVKINKDASLDIAEKIMVQFSEPRHGIIRKIPYRYKLQSLPDGVDKARMPMQSGGYNRIIIENIKVPGWKYEVRNEGDFKSIKIGSADKYIRSDQQFIITYHVENAINFFKNHSEFYFNLIGDQWATTIALANFVIQLPQPLSDTSNYFVATGEVGSRNNKTITKWINNTSFSGKTTEPLNPYEGLTVGISFPEGYLIKPDYTYRGIYWLLLPVFIFAGMLYAWKKWGKDDEVVVQT